MSQNQSTLFFIFGGSGDLAFRKLYPALYQLYKKNYLNKDFAVIGTARRGWTDEHYRKVIHDSIKDIQLSEKDAKEFTSHFYYLAHNIKDSKNYHVLAKLANKLDAKYQLNGNRLFYLSVSPRFFGLISTHLHDQGLLSNKGYSRLIIEKPFGTNLEESNDLNNELLKSFAEEQIYRIDHYLGKEMIQTIPTLRFGNSLIKKIWNKEFISNIQVTLAEDIGVEERGGYYEQSGALRDMVQNHLLQIVSLVLMDEPTSLDSHSVCGEKINALKHLIPITDETLSEYIVLGQYTNSPEYPEILAYRSENQVDSNSHVETFVAGKIESTAEKWRGVPLYFRTGKRMREKMSRIDVVFKKDLSLLFDSEFNQNILSIYIGPKEGITFRLNSKEVGMALNTEPIKLKYKENDESPDDYERLLLNALQADKTNFVHAIEVAESWKYIDAIRAAWKKEKILKFYPVKTNGPKEAYDLIEKNGHYWVWD